MNIFERAAGISRPRWGRQSLVSLLSLALFFTAWPQRLSASQDAQAPAPPQDAQAPVQAAQTPPYTQQTPEQLQQLVAPIALYPDSLVAQILAASTFPEQVVEADRWVQAHPDLKGDALGQAVDQQPWDPSVKALAAFPSVLGNMDKNLSWTSSLGDAYYNQQQDVMDAVQVMRRRAQEAGNLKTTPQQTVTTQDSNIGIEPASPDVVYVPAYDPWLVYGGPVRGVAGMVSVSRNLVWRPVSVVGARASESAGSAVLDGAGVIGDSIGITGTQSTTTAGTTPGAERFITGAISTEEAGERGGFNGQRGARAGINAGNRPSNGNIGGRGGVYNRPGATARPFNGNKQAARGYAEPRGQSGVRSGAFSGYDHGGQARSFSSRGSASFGGGAGRGGGGSHGGGGGRR